MNDNDKIKKYYKNIEEPVIDNYLGNEKLKNLLKLSLKTELFLFKKKKNKWTFKNTRQIVNRVLLSFLIFVASSVTTSDNATTASKF